MRPLGPAGIGASIVLSARSRFDSSAERVIEIAFIAIDRRPARNAWLFDAAVQAKISLDIPFRNISRAKLSTWTVFRVFSVTRWSRFWMKEPKHIIIAISAMLESIS